MFIRTAGIVLVALLALATNSAIGAEQKNENNALSSAERARVRAQVESIQKAKLQAGERSIKSTKEKALRQSEQVDRKLQSAHEQVDKDTEGLSWVYGRDAARVAGNAKKRQLEESALSEKQRINREAQKTAGQQSAAAKKAAESVNETVAGLKSQVGKNGKYGLQPHGSDLHVRNYGVSGGKQKPN